VTRVYKLSGIGKERYYLIVMLKPIYFKRCDQDIFNFK